MNTSLLFSILAQYKEEEPYLFYLISAVLLFIITIVLCKVIAFFSKRIKWRRYLRKNERNNGRKSWIPITRKWEKEFYSNMKLDYLFVGSITNDRNSYGQYGKNVLQVMENIKKGAHTIIVNEEDLPLDLL